MRGAVIAVTQLLGIGWYVAVSIIGGLLGGVWLDGRLGLSPLFSVLGLGLGIVVAGVGVYRMLAAVILELNRAEDGREKG